MTKEKKILKNFILYFLLMIMICIVGISNVFGLEYSTSYADIQQYYDNNGNSVTAVNSTWNESLQSYISASIYTLANSYGAGVSFNSPIPIVKNHTYSLSIPFANVTYSLAKSSKSYVSLGNSVGSASYNYAHNQFDATTELSTVSNNRILQFVFKASQNAEYLFIPWTTSSSNSQSYFFNKIIIEDLGDSGVSQTEINNSLNNQTTILNNSITSSTNTITSNDNNNRDLIINSQEQTRDAIIQNQNDNNDALIENDNANTDKIIEENKKTFNDCRESKNLLDLNRTLGNPSDRSYVNSTKRTFNYNEFIIGISGNNYYYPNYITSYNLSNNNITINTQANAYGLGVPVKVEANETYTLSYSISVSANQNVRVGFYSSDGTWLSQTISTGTNNYLNIITPNNCDFMVIVFTPPANTETTYSKIQLEKSNSASNYEQYGEEICVNKLDEQNKTSKGILGKLGDLLSYINPTSENFFVYKLIELLGDLLKDLFVPSSQYLNNWYNDFRQWIEQKLGFLATPITLFLDFINLYLNLEEGDLIISIPQITVPNFENNIIIQAQTFNWGQLLRSKPAFLNMWNLYLDFIDVFLILNFLGLCEITYNRIFGGDTSQYEYYTVEDTYSINDETGEATNHQLRQRRTRREKVE